MNTNLAQTPYRLFSTLLAALVSAVLAFAWPAAAAADEADGLLISGNDSSSAANRTVRAGVFAFEGYHVMDDNGALYGYGIEVLEMISKYSHLNFDLVAYESSWNDMLTMLEAGDIDVVTSASKTPERERTFDFSLPIGRKSTVLSIAVDDDRFVAGNYSTYNGMVVGEIQGNSQNQIFAEFASEKGFDYSVMQFGDDASLVEALQDGTVNAILTSDLRKRTNEKTLETIEENDYYAIVRKGDAALLDEINYAIEQMNMTEGDWQNTLYYEYYGPSYSSQLDFTERERAYIEAVRAGEKRITVTAFADRRPYSYEESGTLTGILLDYFAAVMDVAELPYEVMVPKTLADYESLIRNERVDVILDAIQGEHADTETFANGFSSELFMNASVVQVTRTDFSGPVRTIAVFDSSTGSLDAFLTSQENAELLHYPNREAALQAVLDGQADCTYVYDYTAQEFMNRDLTNSLSYSAVYGLDVQFAMQVNANADHELVSILNKCIKQVPESTLNALVAAYTNYDLASLNLFQYLWANPLIIAVLVLVLLLVAAVIAALVLRSRWNERLAASAQYANNAKTTFLNNMSHDIRTPMNSIIGFTALAGAHAENTEQVKDYLGKIMTSSNHLLSLINDVLDMSRIESGKVRIDGQPTNLTQVMQDLRTIVQADVKTKRLAFAIDMSGVTDDVVVCDKLRLNQVLLNILSNAIKYTEADGAVDVRVVQSVVDAETNTAEYTFTIADTGIGMSEQFLSHVFEPFEREETATVSGIQGTGLGLAITKNLVDLMGGTISVTSTVGEGSEFVVTFPFEISSEQVAVTEESGGFDSVQDMLTVATEKLGGKRILLAEDNMMSREIAKTILGDVNIIVDDVEDGSIAVERIKENPAGTYDVVLTDVQMPIMNGYETTRAIRALDDPAKASIPIIAVTANVFEEDRERAEEAGVSGYIPKPIEIEKLLAVLEDLLD